MASLPAPTRSVARASPRSRIRQEARGTSTLAINCCTNPNPTAAYSNDSKTDSALHIVWDGDTSNTVNGSGLGGIDLSDGGTENLVSILAKSDLSGLARATGTITIYSGASNFSSATFGLPGLVTAAPFSSINLAFASFVVVGSTGADFMNVGAVVLDLNGPASLDAVVDFIGTTHTETAEPATIAVLGLGLAGLGFVHRRKR